MYSTYDVEYLSLFTFEISTFSAFKLIFYQMMNWLIGWSFQRYFGVQGRAAAAVDLIVRWYHAQLTSKPPSLYPKLKKKKMLVVKHSLMGEILKVL